VTLRVVIVDDMPDTRTALAGFVGATPGVEVVGAAEDAVSASRTVATTRPDVVVLDFSLGEGMGGEDLLDLLRQDCPTAKFVVMSAYDTPKTAALMAEHGAYAFVPKRSLPQIVASLRSILAAVSHENGGA
jgi:DNA-binding NarL/FixJ family response regulator